MCLHIFKTLDRFILRKNGQRNMRQVGIVVFFLILLGCSPENVTFGVLSDIHGNSTNAAYFIEVFRQKNVHAILVPGDLVDHFRNNIPDERELEEILSILDRANVPVYIIPGNHEQQSIYYGVLERKKYTHLVDMSRQRSVDLGDIRIISLPGYTFPEYIAKGGFISDVSDIPSFLSSWRKNILLSHQLPRATLIDIIFSEEHVGDEKLTSVLKQNNIDILVGGHIHESGGIAETRDGIFIPQNTYAETLYLNAGSVAPWQYLNRTSYNGMAAIVTVNKNGAEYEMITIP